MNSKRGAIEFEADGVTYTIRMTTNAQVRFQDAEGKSLIEAMRSMETNVDIKDLRALFQHTVTPDLTAEQAGDVMDAVGILKCASLLGQAVKLAFPVVGTDAANPRPAPSKISSVHG